MGQENEPPKYEDTIPLLPLWDITHELRKIINKYMGILDHGSIDITLPYVRHKYLNILHNSDLNLSTFDITWADVTPDIVWLNSVFANTDMKLRMKNDVLSLLVKNKDMCKYENMQVIHMKESLWIRLVNIFY